MKDRKMERTMEISTMVAKIERISIFLFKLSSESESETIMIEAGQD